MRGLESVGMRRQPLGMAGPEGIALTRNVLIQSTLLSGGAPDDPADRMLLAQAQLGGMSLLTCDAGIIGYARKQAGVPVCDARRV